MTDNILEFTFHRDGGSAAREVAVSNLVIAGWAGRDLDAIEEHIREMEAIGVPRPSSVPCFYRASNTLLTRNESIQVVGGNSSGEIEYFVLSLDDGLWVGVGSDHTDRKVETYNIAVSKQMCAKPVAADLWLLEEISEHWDRLRLKSEAVIAGNREPYQQGTLADMRTPEDLIGRYRPDGRLPAGTLMFCGTLVVDGGVRPGQAFSIELHDPVLNRTISHNYAISALPEEE